MKISRNAWIGAGVALAMIAIGVVVAIDLRKDMAAAMQHEQAREDIRRIARALLAIYQNKLPPRKEDLWHALELPSAPMDPWGRPYDVSFTEGGFTVATPGPDGDVGTQDDVSVFIPFGGNPFDDNAAPAQ